MKADNKLMPKEQEQPTAESARLSGYAGRIAQLMRDCERDLKDAEIIAGQEALKYVTNIGYTGERNVAESEAARNQAMRYKGQAEVLKPLATSLRTLAQEMMDQKA